ncbi:MAG TPA: hypothetical protein PK156_06335 [Polyangium sp.]|nr:hypothetical protein [Polyangium sp.]
MRNVLCNHQRIVVYCNRAILLLSAAFLGGCGDAQLASGTTSGDVTEEAVYAMRVHVVFVDDGQGVAIGAQNGAIVHVPPTEIIGKNLVWATTTGGENIFNVLPIENGKTPIKQDLSAEVQSSARYTNGPWEMAAFVSIAGASPFAGPQPGDLAAFDNSAPPSGQPPVTGVSVRLTVNDADAEVVLGNEHFIQY